MRNSASEDEMSFSSQQGLWPSVPIAVPCGQHTMALWQNGGPGYPEKLCSYVD